MRKIIIMTGGSVFRCNASKRKIEHTQASEHQHFLSDTASSASVCHTHIVDNKISLSALYIVYVTRI